ncbi:MAG: hypothetical protein LBP40_01780 [Campylobacteraceae bacterium]|nr:hypothetical protein [Campylobacteraceae bacterium]
MSIFYSKNIGYFQLNLFRQAKFETKNFIIDVPKFYWIGFNKDNGRYIRFVGVPEKIKYVKKDILPMIDLYDFDDVWLEALEIFCNETFEKTTQTINNWEAEIYSCTTKSRNDLLDKHIVYKNETFHIVYYTHDVNAFENFQKQYDKFFENVKLKE